QHPDHQLRIDRRTTHRRIMRCKFAPKPGQIESSIDLPHQMIFGNRVAEMKLVEQLTLVTLQTAHHRSTSSRFASTQRNHASWPLSIDFCNKIDPEQTSGRKPTERNSYVDAFASGRLATRTLPTHCSTVSRLWLRR